MYTIKIAENTEVIQGQTIGNILIMSGRLKAGDLGRITALQEKEGMLFGEAAVALGLLGDEDISWALCESACNNDPLIAKIGVQN